jgi:hypothetical protein
LAHELDDHPNDLQGKELSQSDLDRLETLGVLQQFPAFRERALVSLAEDADSAAQEIGTNSVR